MDVSLGRELLPRTFLFTFQSVLQAWAFQGDLIILQGHQHGFLVSVSRYFLTQSTIIWPNRTLISSFWPTTDLVAIVWITLLLRFGTRVIAFLMLFKCVILGNSNTLHFVSAYWVPRTLYVWDLFSSSQKSFEIRLLFLLQGNIFALLDLVM